MTAPDETLLFSRLAAAYVRGMLTASQLSASDAALLQKPLDQLDQAHHEQLIALGHSHNIRLHRFKRTMGLARVGRVLGILRGLSPSELLDIGSGRGAFLWPLLDAFPWLPVTAIDTLAHRVSGLQAVAAGGVANLMVQAGDATRLAFADRQFDVVTMLEVLEHIPNTTAALRETMRVARRFLLISVPSKADTNPEHIHLFDAATLEQQLRSVGATRVSFEYVPGHLIAIART